MPVPRLRSLRARLLLATVAIAVAAVAATAWLTSQGTADQVRDDMEHSLEADALIYERLLMYAYDHANWRGVDDLVRELASETGRRIALTTEQGRVLADSSRLDGDGALPLPRRPAAVVDPFRPLVSSGTTTGPGGMVMVDTSLLVDPSFDLTAEEIAERTAMAEQASACLDREGVAHEVTMLDDGVPDIQPDDEDMDSDAVNAAFDRCVPSGLYGPGDAERAAIADVQQRLQACLTDRGVPFELIPDEYYSSSVPEIDPDDARASAAYEDCSAAAERAVYDSFRADPARLYLGDRDHTGLALLTTGGGRTVAAAALVALMAVAVTVLVSRRLLRPVAALTAAAHGMGGGDLTQRVEVRGDDELAGLARSFNAMADAVAAQETQRRRMVSDVAHELRTPLANVRGYLEAALDGVTAADQELLASLHEEAVLLQRLVDDLQTLALAEAHRLALHREPVDLAALADQVVVAHRPHADAAGVDLVVEREGDDPVTVQADPARIRQALGNLVSNAVRHSAAGDRVIGRVGATYVEVVDTGTGIAPEDLPHVFDRFWRADTSRTRDTGGSGLGLAICSQLVQAHGGTVTAASTLGSGSTFTIRLPRP